MPQITIDIKDKELDKKVRIHQVENELPNKADAVTDILKRYFEK